MIGALLVAVALLGVGAQFVSGGPSSPAAAPEPASLPVRPAAGPRALPVELRGVHVTMGLASLPGKLEEYLFLTNEGLTALELDIKDEDGHVGFATSTVRLATKIGAARPFYAPRKVARLVHQRGLYLIGRVVVFEDPVLSQARPDLAVVWPDGSVWRDAAGLGWTNPYDRRVWDYNVDIAAAAAHAGFDEILFDYVRFPSDGAVSSAEFRNPEGLRSGMRFRRFSVTPQAG